MTAHMPVNCSNPNRTSRRKSIDQSRFQRKETDKSRILDWDYLQRSAPGGRVFGIGEVVQLVHNLLQTLLRFVWHASLLCLIHLSSFFFLLSSLSPPASSFSLALFVLFCCSTFALGARAVVNICTDKPGSFIFVREFDQIFYLNGP
jgi:hypothetical protein